MRQDHGGNPWAEGLNPEQRKRLLDFSANINPLGPPAGVSAAIERAATLAGRYPDPACGELRRAAGAACGVPPEQLLPGNGAAELLFALARAALLPGETAAILSPAFSEYRAACESVSGRVVELMLPRETGFLPDDAFLSRIPSDIRILFLCNPNNPTGAVLSREICERLLERAERENFILVADESFLGFRRDAAERSMLPLCADHPHLVVLWSETKLYAIPGARLGYLACSCKPLLERMRSALPPWNVNIFAEQIGLSLLREGEYLRRTRELVESEGGWLAGRLAELPGVTVYPPGANFILFRWNRREDLKAGLLRRGLLIRSCESFSGLDERDWRVCVSTRERNLRLLDALLKEQQA